MKILELFCDVDDFCQAYWPCWEQRLLANGTKHTRHRSVANFLGNLIAGLVAYFLKPLKPLFPLPA
jgi:hypothetical protein